MPGTSARSSSLDTLLLGRALPSRAFFREAFSLSCLAFRRSQLLTSRFTAPARAEVPDRPPCCGPRFFQAAWILAAALSMNSVYSSSARSPTRPSVFWEAHAGAGMGAGFFFFLAFGGDAETAGGAALCIFTSDLPPVRFGERGAGILAFALALRALVFLRARFPRTRAWITFAA